MSFEDELQNYLNKDIVIYGRKISQINYSAVEGELVEIGDGWIRVYCGKDKNESIINLDNVIRVREHPVKANGKKKMILD